jgi:hypothetical protein
MEVTFTEAERAVLDGAATMAGLTPTGYIAEAALAAARRTEPAVLSPYREMLAELQTELFDARVAVVRIGTRLSQAVAALNATGEAPAWLGRAALLCERRLVRLDEVIARVDGRL